MPKTETKDAAAEERQEREEAARLGPPRFARLYAAQDQPERYPVFVGEFEGWFSVKRLSKGEKSLVENAGKEVFLVDDEKRRGQKVQFARDVDPDLLLLKYGIADFSLPTGETDDEGRPVFEHKAGFGSERDLEKFFKRLDDSEGPDEDLVDYMVARVREKNGLALGNSAGESPSDDSTTE